MGKKNQKNQDQKHNQNCNSRRNNSNSDALKSTEISAVEENIDDLISSLSDDILWRIISFLPFESAQKTSFLSTRWRGLWNKALVQHGSMEDIARAIDGFLTHFDELNPLKHPWKLQFHFHHGNTLLATIGANKKLHLDFSTGKQEYPRQFGWHLELKSQTLMRQPSPSTIVVKTLHLTSVSYLTGETVSSMVSNFQFIESLNIIKCDGLRSLSIDAHQKLQCLTVLDCSQLKSFHIRAFKIKSFRFRGQLPWFNCLDYYCFSLEDAMLDFREGPGYGGFNSYDFSPVSSALTDVKILTLCRWTFEALIRPRLSPVLLQHPRYNKLTELQWIDSSIEENKIDALFSFLKRCPLLERLFITIDPARYCLPSTGSCTNQVDTPARLDHLKVIVLEGLMNIEDQVLVAERLLQVVNKEPLIIARSDGYCARRLVKISSHQAKHQKMGKVVAPPGRKCSYMFVKEEKDIIEFCPKHACH